MALLVRGRYIDIGHMFLLKLLSLCCARPVAIVLLHALQPLYQRRACLDDNVSLMGFHHAPPSTLTSIRLLQIGFKICSCNYCTRLQQHKVDAPPKGHSGSKTHTARIRYEVISRQYLTFKRRKQKLLLHGKQKLGQLVSGNSLPSGIPCTPLLYIDTVLLHGLTLDPK